MLYNARFDCLKLIPLLLSLQICSCTWIGFTGAMTRPWPVMLKFLANMLVSLLKKVTHYAQ